MQVPGGQLCRDPIIAISGCFRCFAGKLSASPVSVAAEILGWGPLGQRKNSETPAVFSLFLAVFSATKQRCDSDI
jgi:hypothetical protein